MSFRQIVTEKDLSSFVVGNNAETGGFVIRSRKGPTFPILITNYDEFITWFGEPNQDFWGGYEVLNFIGTAPAWVTRVVGSGYKHSGVDVGLTSVTPFGADTGRTLDSYSLSTLPIQRTGDVKTLNSGVYATGTRVVAKGLNTLYEGNIFDSLGSATFQPNTSGNLRLRILNNKGVFIREISNLVVTGTGNSRTIAGTGLDNTPGSTLNVSTGAISLDFSGSIGSAFQYTSGKGYASTSTVISLPSNKTWGIYLKIDGVVIENLPITDDGSLTVAEVVSQLNTAINNSDLKRNDLVSAVEINTKFYIRINGTIGSVDSNFRMKGALNTEQYLDPIQYIFEDLSFYESQKVLYDGIKESLSGADPTGAVLKNGEYVEALYIVSEDKSADITHSFFASSPYDDKEFDYRVYIRHTPDATIENGQRIYELTLYINTINGLTPLAVYTYSLDKIKTREGQSLYIMDVFRNNPYLVPVVNTTLTSWSTVNANVPSPIANLSIKLTGGKKGGTPTDTDVIKAWGFYKKAKRYPIKTFMNIYGDTASFNAIKDLVTTYQKYSFGISIIPFNYTPQDAIDYRRSLGVDSDKLALYHNWELIQDVLGTGSFVWVSGLGKVGAAFARMEDIFDAESPAGVNENGIGGQLGILSPYSAVELQYDYEDNILKALDDAQINPKVLDPLYGLIIKGDRTLQVTRGDTSFIGARRLYNYILSNIIDQVLTLQEFRLNDSFHRARMATFCSQIIQPILNSGYLREAQIICDESNNTDEVLNRREFVIDIYVKVTPNSQVIKLNFIRLSQTQSIANVL